MALLPNAVLDSLHVYLLFLLPLVFLLKLARRGKLNLPPSPPKIPIIGNLHQLGKLPHRSLQALARKYGPVMLVHFGQNPTLVVSTAEMAKEVMKNHDVVFSSRPRSLAADILLYGGTDIGFAPYSDYWRQAKKISVVQLLSLKRVQSFRFVREEEVADFIDRIRGASIKGDTVNLSEMVGGVVNSIVARSVFSRRAELEDGRTGHFGLLARKVMLLLATFSFGDMFPFLGWLDSLSGFFGRLKATSKELDEFFDRVIEERNSSQNTNDQVQRHSATEDFLQILLQLRKDGMLDVDLNLKAILMDMFVGGTDTTSTTIEWAMAELLKNPCLMKKAQEEVRNVVGKKGKLDENDINQMGYLKCFIKEALRLHAPVPLLVPRKTTASAKLGGYDIPPNTRVFINAWAIQRDPKVWDRPEEFLPERFQEDSVDFKDQDFRFLPFGGGRRSCPGVSFAIAALECVVANLLYWFDWKLPGGAVAENLDMSEANGLTVSKKIPLHLVPIFHTP